VLSPFKSAAMLDYADVILPVSPFSETSRTYVNAEGRAQSFYAVVKPQGETRPAWKVLRVLGNLLDVAGFDYNSSEDVRAEALGGKPEFVAGLDNGLSGVAIDLGGAAQGIERLFEVPIHFADAIARRAPALQQTRDAVAPVARMNAATLARIGVRAGEKVRLGGTAVLDGELDAGLPDNVVRVAAAHPATVSIAAVVPALTVEKA